MSRISPFVQYLARYRHLRRSAANALRQNHPGLSALQSKEKEKRLARYSLALPTLKTQGFNTREAQYLLRKQFPRIRFTERWMVQHRAIFKLTRDESRDLISIWNQIFGTEKQDQEHAHQFPNFVALYYTWRVENRKSHPRQTKDRMAFAQYFSDQANLNLSNNALDVLPCFGLTGLSEQGFQETFARYQEEDNLHSKAAQQHLLRHALDELVTNGQFVRAIRGILARGVEPTPEWLAKLEVRFPGLRSLDGELRDFAIEANLERSLAHQVSQEFVRVVNDDLIIYAKDHPMRKVYHFVLKCLERYDLKLYLLQLMRRWFSL